MGAQNAVNATVARAYLEVAPGTGPAQQQEVARALFGGRHPDRVSLEYGVPLTQCYTVLAVAATDARGARAMGALQELLARQCGYPVPALLSEFGGTILVPGTIADAEEGPRTFLTRVPLTASVVRADPAAIPAVAETAHELLDVARRVYGRPGLYPFEDLGPANADVEPCPADANENDRIMLENNPFHHQFLLGLGCAYGRSADYPLCRIGAPTCGRAKGPPG